MPGPAGPQMGLRGQPGPGTSGSGAGAAGDRAGRPAPPYPPGWVGSPWVNPHRHTARQNRRGPLPPIRRRWDASVLAALLVVVFGAAWLIGGLGAVHLSTEAVLASGLMLLGAALVVTARTDWSLSRHAWPVLLGGVLVVGLLATSTTFGVNGALSHMSIGTMSPPVPAKGGTVYGGIGQLTVNAMNVTGGSTIKVESIAGETSISVPPGSTIEGKVLAGQICVNGGPSSSGIGASLSTSIPTTSVPTTATPATSPSAGSSNSAPSVGSPITLYLHQVAGEVVINGHGQGCRGR